MKKILSIILAFVMLSMSIATYADTADIDSSKQVISYTVYDEITDYDLLCEMADAGATSAATYTATAEPNNRIKVAYNEDDQLIVDQVLTETVYANGDIVEDRVNTLYGTVTTNKINTQTNVFTGVTAISKIYYTFTESEVTESGGVTSVQYAHHLQKASITITRNTTKHSVSAYMELAVIGPFGFPCNDEIVTATYSNIPLNTAKYVYYNEAYNYNFTDPTCVVQLYTKLTLGNGVEYEFYHSYMGENDWPTRSIEEVA